MNKMGLFGYRIKTLVNLSLSSCGRFSKKFRLMIDYKLDKPVYPEFPSALSSTPRMYQKHIL